MVSADAGRRVSRSALDLQSDKTKLRQTRVLASDVNFSGYVDADQGVNTAIAFS
jgi:hypothetical protein